MSEILDLDILKPAKKILKLNGKEFDVSFLPTGITYDIDKLLGELGKISKKEIEKNPELCKKAFDLSVKICATFAEVNYPEMDYEWFRKNTSAPQLNGFVDAIKESLIESYKGVEKYGKK